MERRESRIVFAMRLPGRIQGVLWLGINYCGHALYCCLILSGWQATVPRFASANAQYR